MTSQKLNFIEKNRPLFWSVSQGKLADIGDALLVETILNYGEVTDVRELFSLLGLEKTATIFYEHTENKPRHNYLPIVKNYFTLYFNRHVRQYSIN